MLKEGKANILYVEQKLEKDDDGYIKAAKSRKRIANEINETRGSVFYNPVQEFNRDISITVIREFIKIQREELDAKGKDHNKDGVYILEALAATGLRSVRYCKEIDNIKKIYSNDLDPKAVELMKKNFEFNDIDQIKYEASTMDAITLMH